MPGFLTGLEQGIEQNRQRAVEQARIGLESQRLGMQQAQIARQNARQDLHDSLSALDQTIQSEAAGTEPARAIVEKAATLQPQGPRPDDPQAAAQWDQQHNAYQDYLNHDDYKTAQQSIADSRARLLNYENQKTALLGKAAHIFAGDAHNDADIARYNLAQGNDLGSRGAHALVMKESGGMNPDLFTAGPNGQMPADPIAQQLEEFAKTGDPTGKGQALTAIMPMINSAIGAKLPNGNTITNAQVTHFFLDPKDPTNLHYTLAVGHEADDGSNAGVNSTPHQSEDHTIPFSALKQGAEKFLSTYKLARDPRVQSGLQKAAAGGPTALSDYMALAARGGYREPPPDLKAVGPFQTLYKVNQQTGQLESVASGQKKPLGGTLGLVQEIAEHPELAPVLGQIETLKKNAKYAPTGHAGQSVSDYNKQVDADPDLSDDEKKYLKNQFLRHKAGIAAPSSTQQVKVVDLKTGKTVTRTVKGAPAKAPPPPKAGAVENGYQFKGGDPADPKNWKKL